jgi:hypothetical protein
MVAVLRKHTIRVTIENKRRRQRGTEKETEENKIKAEVPASGSGSPADASTARLDFLQGNRLSPGKIFSVQKHWGAFMFPQDRDKDILAKIKNKKNI